MLQYFTTSLLFLIQFNYVLANHSLPKEHKKWAILHYGAGDNTLSDEIFEDAYELERVGSGDDVHIVSQTDGGRLSESYNLERSEWMDVMAPIPIYSKSGKFIRWSVDPILADHYPEAKKINQDGTQRWYLEKEGNLLKYQNIPLEHLGYNVDMSSSKTLLDFLKWGKKNFPADHYVLILGSHGDGVGGVNSERNTKKYKDTFMPILQLDNVLGQFKKLHKEGTAIIVMDACYMSELAVVEQLKDKAQYLFLSQIAESAKGHNWEHMLDGLHSARPSNIDEMALFLFSNYIPEYLGVSTMAMIDTSKVDKLLTQMDELAKALLDGPHSISDIKEAWDIPDKSQAESGPQVVMTVVGKLEVIVGGAPDLSALTCNCCSVSNNRDLKELATSIYEKKKGLLIKDYLFNKKARDAALKIIETLDSDEIFYYNSVPSYDDLCGIYTFIPAQVSSNEDKINDYLKTSWGKKSHWGKLFSKLIDD